MNTLAVILARAGSVGLANKHLLPLCGKPVISYTFAHARAASTLTRIVVSSDCREIRDLAGCANLEAIARPACLATGDASVQDVMLHAMDTVECTSPFRADALVMLYGNVPVRPAGAIDGAVNMLFETGCDSVRSFCPVGKWHPAWMSRLEGGRVVALQPGSIHRRQDLTPLFLHDGAVVAVSRASMLRGRTCPADPHAFFGDDRRAIETGAGETVEIDQLRDLYWAQAVLHEGENKKVRIAS
ncbi:MAG TPA: acylneuraminate cytidylyltransferase family protein [Tepidisphaeraceae bacterium]|nr:acylneuraminate cytidylyltransferase family protein [Tepidisphaeraceae bacterium]